MTDRSEPSAPRRVGELAASTGLTVRTLHHYEQVGLLGPPERSPAGHRLYSNTDVERLYRVSLLRRLGLSLEAIRSALDDPNWQLRQAVETHLSELEAQLDRIAKLRGDVANLVASLDHRSSTDNHTDTDNLLRIIEEMTNMNNTLTRRISILVYSDLGAAYDYLVDVFGLGPGEITRDDTEQIVHAELHVGDGVIWLHPESEEFRLASPATTGAATAMMAVMVDDVDEHHRWACERGAQVVYAPIDQPYGYREYSARDCEGALWSFMKLLD